MGRRYFSCLIITFLIFFFSSKPALAVSVNITETPSQVTQTAFPIKVSVSGADPGINYLRANFFTPQTTNYFGLTYNGNYYYNGSDFKQYFPIGIDQNGNWSGYLHVKMDDDSKYFKESGAYNLKVRRYTPSAGYIWSNEVSLNVNIPTSNSTSPIPSPSLNNQSSTSENQTPSNILLVSNIPSQINSNQSFDAKVDLSFPQNPNSFFYLKGSFKKSDSTNYFGQTLVAGAWIKNSSSYSNQVPIQTDAQGNWSGFIQVMPDQQDSGFTGTGNYIFKVAKYSSSGSLSWSNELPISINLIPLPSSPIKTSSIPKLISSPNSSSKPSTILANPVSPSNKTNTILGTNVSNAILPSLTLDSSSSSAATQPAQLVSNDTPKDAQFLGVSLPKWTYFSAGIVIFLIAGFTFVKMLRSRYAKTFNKF